MIEENNPHGHLYRRLISATTYIFNIEHTSHKVGTMNCVVMFEQVQFSYIPPGEPFSVDSPLGEHSTRRVLVVGVNSAACEKR